MPPQSVPARARLFLFDPNSQARKSLHELFEDEGFDVVGASGDAGSALRQILDLRPDVCVLDAGFPSRTGVSLCKQVHIVAPDIPCIVLAAWHTPELAHASTAAGAHAFVLKNVFAAELLTAVTAALALGPGGQRL
ncbi:response regulator transcription factor [Sinomonas flava]|uniref:response regulator n=1 Tax=Sinomonas flava TaxID=496857 RepID=UPI0039A66DA5